MKVPRKLWIALGVAVVLVVVVLLVLPLLIDVNRYRDVIESRAEDVLGREVRLGEMRLSLLPSIAVSVDDLAVGALPEEGEGDLLKARRLRVGARLFPLLGGRLEVTSATIEGPELTLVRGADGSWNVQRLIATDAEATEEPDETSGDAATTFRIDSLRITDGRVVVRDAARAGAPLEATLADLDLRLDDFAPDRVLGFRLATTWEEVPDSRIEVEGKVGPLVPGEGEPMTLQAAVEVTGVDVERVLQALGDASPLPAGLVGGRDVELAAAVDAGFGAANRIAVADVVVRGLDVGLRRDASGAWNLPGAQAASGDTGGEAAAGEPGSESEFSLAGLSVRDVTLRYEDSFSRGEPLSVEVGELSLDLDRLPTDGPASLELSAVVDGSGKLAVGGTLGPLDEDTGSIPVQLSVSVDPVPTGVFRMISGEGFALDTDAGTASVALEVSGRAPEALRVHGTATVSGFEARITGTEGEARTVPLNAGARYDVTVENAGDGIRIDRFALDLSGNTLAVEGSVRRENEALHRLDLRLLPCRIPADDLAGLAALAVGDLPFSFGSDTPIALDARVHGLAGEDRLPEIEGQVALSGFEFMHESLREPLTGVGGTVRLEGERIDVRGLTGGVGSSDFAGDLTVQGFKAPRVRFTLHSRNADFGELFSFLSTEEESAATPAADTEGGGDPLALLTLEGDVRIDRGAFDTLKFTDLDAHMTWVDRVLTLDPVKMNLYDGAFRGSVTSDMKGAEPTFDIRGDAAGVDLDSFLGDNLGTPGVLYGKFHGEVETRTAGADYESIVRGLKGEGQVEVLEGRVGGLDILETLSKVSGFFGESTLQSLSGQLAAEGTEFRTMAGGVRFDGGRMGFDDLVVESPYFSLQGTGSVDMLGAALDGDFRLFLSSELSQSMRAESSRAGKLFWNPRSRRVEVPFRLAGPFAAPSPSVDWEAVADAALRGKAEEEIQDWIGDRLGLSRDEEPEPTPSAVKTETKASTAAGDDTGGGKKPEGAPAAASGLRVEITKAGMGGNFLAPDLKVEGKVHGARLDRAEVTVIDARGQEVRRADRLRHVDEFLGKSGDRNARHSIQWWYEADGKSIVGARYPLSVTVVVYDTAGGTAEARVQVNR
jgi:uncharacterized protein involved in outer membrane biogenesis